MRKAFQKSLYSFLVTKWGVACCLLGALLTLNATLQLLRALTTSHDDQPARQCPTTMQALCKDEPIDIVYTWVNGSDPRHRESVETEKRKHDPTFHGKCRTVNVKGKNETSCSDDDVSASRFVDNEELRYSLRSLEKFTPWVRNIYLVTSGQIPYWLNVDHPRMTVVTHESLFLNKSHLPTFSSPAIESHIHRIPGLSDKFLYLNDDVMFGNEVWPEDFYTRSNGQKVYLSWAVPNCRDGCPSNWIGDKYCDAACNYPECDFDGGDCVNGTSQPNRWWGGGGGATNRRWTPPANNQPHTGGHAPAPPAFGSRFGANYCAKSCPDSWVGDKYCDRSCQNLECGFDAGDCGVEALFHGLYGVAITSQTDHINVPDGVPAMYFNLSAIVRDGKIVDGSHDNAALIRTATISQKNKVMTLTFHRNITRQDVSISITVEFNNSHEETIFNLTASTYVHPTPPPSANNTTNTTLSEATPPLATAGSNSTATAGSNPTATAASPTAAEQGDKLKPVSAPQAQANSADQKVPPEVPPPTANKPLDNTPPSNDPNAVIAVAESAVPSSAGLSGDQKPLVAEKANQLQPPAAQGGSVPETAPGGARKLLEVEEGAPLEQTARVSSSSLAKRRKTGKESEHWMSRGMRRVIQGITVLNGTRPTLSWKEITRRKLADLKEAQRLEEMEEYRQWYQAKKLEKQRWIEEEDQRRKAMKSLEVPAEEGPYPWEVMAHPGAHDHAAGSFSRRKLLDLFGDSLKFVDRLYSKNFGSAARKVPAHMPHMIDKNKMTELQNRWPDLWDATSSHQFRASNDMQYAFSYFYFLIHQKRDFDIQTVWHDDLDVDHDGVLNDNELRTLSIKINGLPVQDKHLEELSHSLRGNTSVPIDYRALISNAQVMEKLQKHYTGKGRNKYEILGTDEVAFLMVSQDYAKALKALDGIRERRHKFICLNDNMNHSHPDSAKTLQILKDFYESLFPIPSIFELPPGQRNEYLYIDELRNYQELKRQRRVLLYIVLAFLLVFALIFAWRWCQSARNRGPPGYQHGRERRTREQRFKRLLSI